jgi:ribosome-associated protein
LPRKTHGRNAGADANDEWLDEASPEQGEGPSRTARKNASKELTRLGEQLVALRPDRLATLVLPERLLEAIAEAKRLTSFGAKRRQAQFIGKLMRKLDEQALDAIRKALRAQ